MARFSRVLLVLPMLLALSSAALSPTFYATSCPKYETIVKAALTQLLNTELVPALVRLHFHDCLVLGCDASILLANGPPGGQNELAFGGNAHIAGIDAINTIKKAVEAACPGVVSCADILNTATRDAIASAGGPVVALKYGRKDGLVSSFANAAANLPPVGPLDEIIARFAKNSLSAVDMTILSGGHTVGRSHCSAGRANNLTAAVLAANARASCKVNGGGHPFNDLVTPTTFDNQYFKNVLNGFGPFVSDILLGTDPRTAPTVRFVASTPLKFSASWKRSWGRMSLLNNPVGEIRKNCQLTNAEVSSGVTAPAGTVADVKGAGAVGTGVADVKGAGAVGTGVADVKHAPGGK